MVELKAMASCVEHFGCRGADKRGQYRIPRPWEVDFEIFGHVESSEDESNSKMRTCQRAFRAAALKDPGVGFRV